MELLLQDPGEQLLFSNKTNKQGVRRVSQCVTEAAWKKLRTHTPSSQLPPTQRTAMDDLGFLTTTEL
jgi:hypothetical protein